jgi:hypothetical protein
VNQVGGVGVGKQGDLGTLKGAAAGGGTGDRGVAGAFLVLVMGAGAFDKKFADFRFLCQSLTPFAKGWASSVTSLGLKAYGFQ